MTRGRADRRKQKGTSIDGKLLTHLGNCGKFCRSKPEETYSKTIAPDRFKGAPAMRRAGFSGKTGIIPHFSLTVSSSNARTIDDDRSHSED
jgi:hypothetical protein